MVSYHSWVRIKAGCFLVNGSEVDNDNCEGKDESTGGGFEFVGDDDLLSFPISGLSFFRIIVTLIKDDHILDDGNVL